MNSWRTGRSRTSREGKPSKKPPWALLSCRKISRNIPVHFRTITRVRLPSFHTVRHPASRKRHARCSYFGRKVDRFEHGTTLVGLNWRKSDRRIGKGGDTWSSWVTGFSL